MQIENTITIDMSESDLKNAIIYHAKANGVKVVAESSFVFQWKLVDKKRVMTCKVTTPVQE